MLSSSRISGRGGIYQRRDSIDAKVVSSRSTRDLNLRPVRAKKKGHQTETGFFEESNSLPFSQGILTFFENSKGSSSNRPLDLRLETGKYDRLRSDTNGESIRPSCAK